MAESGSERVRNGQPLPRNYAICYSRFEAIVTGHHVGEEALKKQQFHREMI